MFSECQSPQTLRAIEDLNLRSVQLTLSLQLGGNASSSIQHIWFFPSELQMEQLTKIISAQKNIPPAGLVSNYPEACSQRNLGLESRGTSLSHPISSPPLPALIPVVLWCYPWPLQRLLPPPGPLAREAAPAHSGPSQNVTSSERPSWPTSARGVPKSPSNTSLCPIIFVAHRTCWHSLAQFFVSCQFCHHGGPAPPEWCAPDVVEWHGMICPTNPAWLHSSLGFQDYPKQNIIITLST